MIPQVALGEITSEVSRPVALEPGVPYRSVGVKWYGAGVHVHETREGQLFDADRFQIEQDDLIYNDMWARMGSVAIVPPDLAGSVASSHFPTFRLDESKVIPAYLAWYFRSPSFWNDCENASRGSTGRNQIKRSTFAAIRVPLPPLDEQRRIAARIKELAAKAADAQRARTHTINELAALHAKLLFSQFEPVRNASTPIGSAFIVTTGGTPSRSNSSYWNGENAWVSSGEVAFRDIFDTREKITDLGLKESNAKIYPAGTVLLAMIGQGKTRGQCAILQRPAATNQNVAAIHVTKTSHSPRYVYWWLYSNYQKSRSTETGTAQPALSADRVKRMTIPLPDRAQQERIVSRLDALQVKIDAVKALYTQTAEELNAMLPAILDKAFKGAL